MWDKKKKKKNGKTDKKKSMICRVLFFCYDDKKKWEDWQKKTGYGNHLKTKKRLNWLILSFDFCLSIFCFQMISITC